LAHTIRSKTKLLGRVRRIRGQVEALERALKQEHPCGDVLRLIAAGRGAMDSLMAEVIEGHIRDHALSGAPRSRAAAAEELIEIVRAYLR
jgi:FrmR/RcnR family transcriptional regulator, repressor of frmRAB operon